MPASIAQIITAKNDGGLLARAIAAAEQLGVDAAQHKVEQAFGQIVAAEVPDGGQTTSIAYALDYHRESMRSAVHAANQQRTGQPAIPLDLSQIGADPLGVSDQIISAAVRNVLKPTD